MGRTPPATGQEYIGKYVPFIHYVERLYLSATIAAVGHEPEAEHLRIRQVLARRLC